MERMNGDIFYLPIQAGSAALGVELRLDLMVAGNEGKVVGFGRIKDVNELSETRCDLVGDYSPISIIPHNTHMLIVLEGRGEVKVRLVLYDDWSVGVVCFSYLSKSGELKRITDVPAKRLELVGAV